MEYGFSCYHPKSLVSLLTNSKALLWMEEREQRSDFNSGWQQAQERHKNEVAVNVRSGPCKGIYEFDYHGPMKFLPD